jgi:hypothetical protein
MLVFASCDEKGNGKVSADDVNNSESAEGKKDIPLASIKFDSDTFNFGEVMEGEKVSHSYKFTNTGKNNLVITKAYGSCGCTVPEWPKEPIKPGATGTIDVVFNSENRPGKALKSVTVLSNTEPSDKIVYLVGNVIGSKKDE